MSGHGRIFAIVALCGTAMLFAAYRVSVSTRTPSPTEMPGQREILRAIENAVTPDYTASHSQDEQTEFHRLAGNAARRALLEIPQHHRPAEQQLLLLTEAFADYLTLYWAGSVDDAVAAYSLRGIPLPRPLANDDAANRDQSWAMATVWARHRPVDFSRVRAGTRYLRGEWTGMAGQSGAASTSRRLRSGKVLHELGHGHTAYDLIVPVVVPNLDGKSEHKVDVHIVFVDDRPRGGWDVIMTTSRGLPEGKFFILPIP